MQQMTCTCCTFMERQCKLSIEREEQVLKQEKWCEVSSVLINVSKTKELVLNQNS